MNSNLLRSLKRAGLLVTCTGSLVVACNVYDDSLLLPGDGGAGTGGTGAAGGSGGNSGTGNTSSDKFWHDMEGDNMECPTEGVPLGVDRPSDTAEGDVGPIYVVMNRVRFGGVPSLDDEVLKDTQGIDDQAWKGIGFNLDQSCNASS